MASVAGSPPSPPLQDNVDAKRYLREAEDHLRKAIKELQIYLIIGFSSQESRLMDVEIYDKQIDTATVTNNIIQSAGIRKNKQMSKGNCNNAKFLSSDFQMLLRGHILLELSG
nr:hypothetical protein CFP56_39395 [Quercus suber]